MKTSNMDYEKKYKEALEKIRSLHRDYNQISTLIDVKEELENIFPELAESKDERIELLNYLYDVHDDDEERARWIAWLEKQGEQKSYASETMNEKGDFDNDFTRMMEKEQKSAEEYNITGIGSKNAQGKLGEMIKNLKPVNEVLEQKPTWSEEDERMLDTVIEDIIKLAGPYVCYHKDVDWLKSLKDRVLPQPKQEWSEEDEKMLDEMYKFFDTQKVPSLKHNMNDYAKFIKSLRPQSTWKPTDEQIKVLNEVINFAADHGTMRWNDYIYNVLKSLREQLKKL